MTTPERGTASLAEPARRLSNGMAAVLLIFVWALAVLPNLTVRSFVWEEGRSAELARDILVRGDLLEPSIYGERWVEKPSLLPWMIAGVARGDLPRWMMILLAFYILFVPVLSRDLIGRKLSLLLSSYHVETFAIVGLLAVVLGCRRLGVLSGLR